MSKTSIQWTDDSHNPIRARLRDAAHAGLTKGGYGSGVGHYCEKISSGCAKCYSSTTQTRFGMPEFPGAKKLESLPVLNDGSVPLGDVEVFLDEKRLAEPLSWKRPRKVFLCDMTDLFGPWVPFEWIDKIFAVMALTPHITWQVLTKRPERAAEYMNTKNRFRYVLDWYQHEPTGYFVGEQVSEIAIRTFTKGGPSTPEHIKTFGKLAAFKGELLRGKAWPLPNVWLGTSVEDQQRADERIPHLLKCPAAVRFLSCEPLLGPITIPNLGCAYCDGPEADYHESCMDSPLHWVIVGGESGPGPRPCRVEWIRSIVQQCKAAGVAAFVKQLGAHPQEEHDGDDFELVDETGVKALKLRDSKGGDLMEFPDDLRVREFPAPRGAGGERSREA